MPKCRTREAVRKLREKKMQRIRELNAVGYDDVQIAEILKMPRTTVSKYRLDMSIPPPRKKRWTHDLIKIVIDRIQSGHPRKQVAKLVGVTDDSLKKMLYNKFGGNEYDTYHNPINRMSLAWKMFSDGMTRKQISQKLGVSVSTVRNYHRKMPSWWANHAKRQEINNGKD